MQLEQRVVVAVGYVASGRLQTSSPCAELFDKQTVFWGFVLLYGMHNTVLTVVLHRQACICLCCVPSKCSVTNHNWFLYFGCLCTFIQSYSHMKESLKMPQRIKRFIDKSLTRWSLSVSVLSLNSKLRVTWFLSVGPSAEQLFVQPCSSPINS